ncbi:unnamed protein product [Rhizoctonia solani]|uniref:ribonuclease Z n=1 Tax=Rhizoctonia solani TaxID=456999 RepID=A0A8H3GE84_9AGAM|nr:unnamed protein product [Rhizoctonia solani]
MSPKTRQSANSNMRWHTRVVSGLTSDTEPCISVHFDTAHYLFNCGEGTTRSFIQQKYGIKKSKAIFLTQTKVSRLGGLTGMLMSLADSGVTNVDVVGPSGLNHFLASTRSYTFRNWMSANTTEINHTQGFEKVYEDTFIRVYAFPMSPQVPGDVSIPIKRKASGSSLRSSSPKRLVRDNSDGTLGSSRQRSPSTTSLKGADADEWRSTIIHDMFPGHSSQNQVPPSVNEEASLPGKSRAPRPRRSLNRLPLFEGPRSTSVVYLVLGPEIRGKFDPAAADNLGVSKRDRGKLTKGESVTVTVNGVQNIVTPDMCMGKSEAPTGFLIVDCPTTDYIPSLPNLKSLLPIQSETPFVLGSIYHRVGPGVLSDPQYLLWTKGIATSECNHLVASDDFSSDSISFQSSAHLSLILSELDKDMFFAPRESGPKSDISELGDISEKLHLLTPGLVTEMTPPKPPIVKLFSGVNNDLYKEDIASHARGESLLSTEDQKDSFKMAREQVSGSTTSHVYEPTPGDDFRVTTLGTGSALPSKYRNVISTVIQMPNYGSIMLDCGENTWGQMCRRFGADQTAPENAYSVLADIKCIFISHIHGDHHMGLLKLLTTRRSLTPAPKEPLYLILNKASELCVREYHDLEDVGLDVENGVKIVQIEKPKGRYAKDDSPGPISTKFETLTGLLGFKSIEAVPVRHRTNSCFGIVARHSNGWSFAYSGDTMPCDTLAEAGKNVTLLIHEASMADEEWEKAAEKGHSTIGQAIEMGARMNAKYLLLTHFSQRYPKIPVINSGLTATALAFDYMTISTPDFWKVGSYMGALEKVFESELAADDDVVMD